MLNNSVQKTMSKKGWSLARPGALYDNKGRFLGKIKYKKINYLGAALCDNWQLCDNVTAVVHTNYGTFGRMRARLWGACPGRAWAL
jgi:hypothetical protein